MDRSRFIAGLLGPTLACVALSLLINRDLAPDMAATLAQSYLLILLAGIATLVTGLAIVLSHNVWKGWPAVLTAFGWLAVIAGVARILFPRLIAQMAPAIITSGPFVFIAAAVFLVLGLFLSWKAFRA